jgi:hypothetical protein
MRAPTATSRPPGTSPTACARSTSARALADPRHPVFGHAQGSRSRRRRVPPCPACSPRTSRARTAVVPASMRRLADAYFLAADLGDYAFGVDAAGGRFGNPPTSTTWCCSGYERCHRPQPRHRRPAAGSRGAEARTAPANTGSSVTSAMPRIVISLARTIGIARSVASPRTRHRCPVGSRNRHPRRTLRGA